MVEGTLPSLQPGTSTAEGNIPHGISNLETATFISGKIIYSNIPFIFPVLSSSGNGLLTIKTVNSTNIVLRDSIGWNAGYPVEFVVEYTKTTD